MAFLNVNSSLVAFSDETCPQNNQPLKKNYDWVTAINGEFVTSPESKPYKVAPGAALNLFSGTRSLSTGSGSIFALTLNPVQSSVYRLTWTGSTAPVFRTDRALALNTEIVTVTVNNNATALFALSSSAPQDFAAVQVGDNVWVPDTYTGDSASPFNSLNTGLWTVLAVGAVSSVANKSLTLRRLAGVPFSAAAEVVTVGANTQFQAFSSGPVQIGDSLVLSAGFSSATWGTYVITGVNSAWVEFTSTNPLPLESGIIPGVSGITIYSQARRFLHLESDQLLVVRVNGDTGSFNKIMPRVVGNPKGVGYWEIWGPVWQLDVVNQSPGMVANLQLISCE